MDQLKYYTLEEDIDHETSFTRIQPQGHYKLIDNLQRVGNLISNSKIELKRFPRQTTKIADPHQGGKASLKFLILCCAEEDKLVDVKESSFGKFIRSHEGGVNKPFENKITFDDERVDTINTPK